MIHRLRLRNWRSYDDLDLQLDAGTTFVVAPNGVGKTSLVYGLAWGVFGHHSDIDLKDCIRAGAASTEVHVELELPDGRRLGISRIAKRRGAPTAVYELNGARLTENAALAEMKQALGIELSVAARLSMMLGGGHIAASGTLNLKNHLHHAFGVAHLSRAVEIAKSVAKESEKARAALRSTTRQRIENRAALESEIARLDKEIADLGQRGIELERIRDTAAAQRSLIERHLALADQFERYERQRSHLVATIEGLLGRAVSPDSNELISSELRSELETSERAAIEMTEGAIKARSVITTAEQAIKLLGGENAVCPTCMRPLSHHERSSAISAHRTDQEDTEAEVRRLEEARRTRQSHAQAVSRVLAQLEALQPPDIRTENTSVPSRAAADALYRQATADLDKHNRRLGGVRSRLESLKAQVDSDDQIQEEERNLRLAYRREAAALAGARVLQEAADHVIKSRIDPMAKEVRRRWKHLFTNNGLIFTPDGSITRSRDGAELSWDTPQRW